MTALTAGLALIPLVHTGDRPGNEVQSPEARIILGVLSSSTLLNLVVVPLLLLRWRGRARPAARSLAEPSAEVKFPAGR